MRVVAKVFVLGMGFLLFCLARPVAVQSESDPKAPRGEQESQALERGAQRHLEDAGGWQHPSPYPGAPDDVSPDDPVPEWLPGLRRSPVHHPVTGFVGFAGGAAPGVTSDDFLVNDDTIGTSTQLNPEVARSSSGLYVVVWMDMRTVYPSVYGQRYDPSGTPIGYNFRVNDVSVPMVYAGGLQTAVGMDSCGNFVIAWRDFRDQQYGDIYAQRYDSSGTALGANFKVNDDAMSIHHADLAFGMDASGNFVIVWDDWRNGTNNYDVWFQRYDSAGNPIGANLQVNDDMGSGWQSDADIVMGVSGGFVIAWNDDRNGEPDDDIYAQRYDSAGTPLGSNFKVNDDAVIAKQLYPHIAADDLGDFVITWRDGRNSSGNLDIYAQRFDHSGTPLDSNFKVSGDSILLSNIIPADVACDGEGHFLITWSGSLPGVGQELFAQRYDSAGNPLGVAFQVSETNVGSTDYPAIASDRSGNCVMTWVDYRNSSSNLNPDIYAQMYDSSGVAVGVNFRVCDDKSGPQWNPAIAADGSGHLVVTWCDQRNKGNHDTYAQRYNSEGIPLGINFQVNDDSGSAREYADVAARASGDCVIAWEDGRNHSSDNDIYCQRYDSSGNPVGSNFKVNEDATDTPQERPAVVYEGSGNFIVAWEDRRGGGNWDVYARRFDSSGVALGSDFKVNDDAGTGEQGYPSVAASGFGGFVITWHDSRTGWDIYAQRYDASGTPLGSNFKVNNDVGTMFQADPDIAMCPAGDFVITWLDARNGYWEIFAQRYDSSGAPIGGNFRVNDDPGDVYTDEPSIAIGAFGAFTVSWVDERNGTQDVYAQDYDASGSPVGGNYLVTDPGFADFMQVNPAIAADECNVYFVWKDDRRAEGWDIYAKINRSDHPPEPFSLVFPPYKAFTPRAVQFDWEDAIDPCPSDQVVYDLYVSTSHSFHPDLTTVYGDLVSSEYYQMLDYGGYCWKVVARDSFGAERESERSSYFVVTGVPYSVGDFNSDGSIDVGDVVFALKYLYRSGPAPEPSEAGDVNCDERIDVGDVVYLINYLFRGGPEPVCS